MRPGEGIKPSVLASVPKLRTCMGFAGSHAGWSNGIQAHARLCRLFSRLEQWMHHPSCTGKVCIGEIGCSSFLNTFLTLKTFLGPLKKNSKSSLKIPRARVYAVSCQCLSPPSLSVCLASPQSLARTAAWARLASVTRVISEILPPVCVAALQTARRHDSMIETTQG